MTMASEIGDKSCISALFKYIPEYKESLFWARKEQKAELDVFFEIILKFLELYKQGIELRIGWREEILAIKLIRDAYFINFILKGIEEESLTPTLISKKKKIQETEELLNSFFMGRLSNSTNEVLKHVAETIIL